MKVQAFRQKWDATRLRKCFHEFKRQLGA